MAQRELKVEMNKWRARTKDYDLNGYRLNVKIGSVANQTVMAEATLAGKTSKDIYDYTHI